MATVTGYQRGNLVFTGAQAGAGNVYQTIYTHPSNASPMRMINAGIAVRIGSGGSAVQKMACSIAVQQNGSTSNIVGVMGRWLAYNSTSLTSFEIPPAGGGVGGGSQQALTPPSGTQFIPSQQGICIPSTNNAGRYLSDQSINNRVWYAAGGTSSSFQAGGSSDYGVWELNPQYFWVLPGDVVVAALFDNNNQPMDMIYNFVTVTDSGG